LLSSGFPSRPWPQPLPQPYAWFDFDNQAGTWRATRHLISQGHRRIALLSENNNQAFITQRRNGYLQALREAGLADTWLRSVPQPAAAAIRRRWSCCVCRNRPRRS
jgi:LacI family transcriptional regulator